MTLARLAWWRKPRYLCKACTRHTTSDPFRICRRCDRFLSRTAWSRH